jgi:hypothetical protein
MIPVFTKSFEAEAAVAGYRFVAFSDVSATDKVSQAAAETDPILGVSDAMGAEAGGMLDVHLGGIAAVQLGGTVTAGAPLTADEDGFAVVAAATASTTVRYGGFACGPGVTGDIIDIWLAPGLLHEA